MQADTSQSPLVGAFVPANKEAFIKYKTMFVAIPSGRGIRSGSRSRSTEEEGSQSQSPLVGAFVPAR